MRGAFFSATRPASIGAVRALAITVLLLLPLAGCIHLPAEVAAVVRESDPPALNNFRPDAPAAPTPERTATRVEPAAP